MIFTHGFLVNARKLSWALYAVIVIVMVSSLIVMNFGETTYGLPLIFGKEVLGDNFNFNGKSVAILNGEAMFGSMSLLF